MNTHPPHARAIRAQLLSAMRNGEYAHSERLPRESALAVTLGISRTQLRDVLASLEREGFITRRHGVGTIINRHVLDVQTRMDIEVEFLDMIRQNGFTAAVASIQTWEDAAGEVPQSTARTWWNGRWSGRATPSRTSRSRSFTFSRSSAACIPIWT